MRSFSSKFLAIFSFFSLISCISLALGKDIMRYTPPIQAVKVYLNAAQITHYQQLSLVNGENKLLFCGIAAGIEPRNIILEKLGPAEVFRLSLIRIGDSTDIFSLDPDILQFFEPSKDSLLNIDKKIQKLQADIEGLEIQKEAIKKNGTPASINLNSADVKANSALLKDAYTYISISIIEKKKQLINTMLERRSLLNNAFGVINNKFTPSSINLILATIRNDSAAFSTRLMLTYLSTEAAWNPSYELNAFESKIIKLDYNAKVLNNTGLTWDNVDLTLSTADPFLYYHSPDLSPVYIGKYLAKNDDQRSVANNAVKGYVNLKVPDREINFNLPKPYLLESKPEAYRLNISVFELHPVVVYRTVPKKETNVYRIALIPDWEKLNLIDGEAEIFNNGKYLGKTLIKPSETEDSLEIPLGIVKNIIVNYKLLSEFSSKKVLGGDIVSTYNYEISIKNNNDTEISLEILDQVPVSAESSVKTQVDEMTEGGDKDVLSGIIVWRKDIPAMAAQTFKLKYSVSYPRRGGYGFPKSNYSYRNTRFL